MTVDLLTPAIAQVCRTCSRITDLGNVSHHKVGLRNCALLAPHIFVGGHHTCENWSARTTEQGKEGV
jgi:hypothetical protein